MPGRRVSALTGGCAIVLVVALGALPLLRAGASGQLRAHQTGDPAAGKQVFAGTGCGACHTLAAAAAVGTVGPNLDRTKPSAERVVSIVTGGSGAMPAFRGQLTAAKIQDLAAFIVQATGAMPTPPTPSGPPAPTRPPPAAAGRTANVTITTSRLTVVPGRVAAGQVALVVRNADSGWHSLVLLRTSRPARQLPLRRGRIIERGRIAVLGVRPGTSVQLVVGLRPGRYVLASRGPWALRRRMVAILRVVPAPTEGEPPAPIAGQPSLSPPPPPPSDGRTLFQASCGGCHAFRAAGTAGTLGPSLDAERPDVEEVVKAVTAGEDGMPSFAGTLSAEQIAAVARFVAESTPDDRSDDD